ncbi:hypothetical protein C8R47DRAFT_1152100 [Mycena vitilis]|nr:hypothetical protein C8R47DRAFT_1152100 [Mycena vitilis]
MSSSALSPASHAVEQFFKWNPPQPRARESHSASTSFREPAYWDRHLDDPLQLKQVKYLPSINECLRAIARGALGSNPNLPEVGKLSQFPAHAYRRDIESRAINFPIRCEADLTHFYSTTTAHFCTTIAGTLEFGLSAWEAGFLEWTVSPARRHSSAIADGYLRAVEELPDRSFCRPTLEASWPEVQAIAQFFPDLAVWEFKSLKAIHSAAFFKAIMELSDADEFPWIRCSAGEDCVLQHGTSTPPITSSPTGHDAPPSVIGLDLAKVRAWDGEAASQMSLKDREKVLHFVQQTWAEGVRHDATFLVFQAGNYEIVGFRHRAEQTLYLSELIEPHKEESYGQLATGLYIAIFREAKKRAEMLSLSIPLSWIRAYNSKPADREADAWPTARPMAEIERIQRRVIGAAFSRPRLIFLVPKTTKSAPFRPNVAYHREKPAGDPANTLEFAAEERIVQAVFQNDDMIYAKGVKISKARLRVDGQAYNPRLVATKRFSMEFSGHVIIKNASTKSQIARLRTEARVYSRLEDKSIQGIPEAVGFFCTKPEGGKQWAALVMSHAGEPIKSSSSLSVNQKNSYLNILRQIHSVGWLHGNLTMGKLLVDSGGSVSIIGFGDVQPTASLESQAKLERVRERHALQLLLGLRTPTLNPPALCCVVNFGPFADIDDDSDLYSIFEAATSWLAQAGYNPIRQVTDFAVVQEHEKSFIALEFSSRQEAELFLLKWPSMAHGFSPLYARLKG